MNNRKFYLFLAMLKDLTPEQRKAIVTALKAEEREMVFEREREKIRHNQMIYEIVHGGNIDV